MKFPLRLTAVALCLLTIPACAGSPLFSPGAKISRAVIPIYLPAQSQPAMVVRIGRISMDYERRGFFRIGVLPLAVLDQVEFEVRQPDQLLEVLTQTQQRLETRAEGRRIELRKFTLHFLNEAAPRLQAGRVRFTKDGQWELLDGLVFKNAASQSSARRGILQVSGPKAGQLSLGTPNSEIGSLFTTKIKSAEGNNQ